MIDTLKDIITAERTVLLENAKNKQTKKNSNLCVGLLVCGYFTLQKTFPLTVLSCQAGM